VPVYVSRYTPEQVASDLKTITFLIKARLRGQFIVPNPRMLYSGRIRWSEWPNQRQFLKQLAWKTSEVYGKYVGCPFWSVAARNRFVACWSPIVRGRPRSPYALGHDLGRQLWEALQLQHEHVFQRKDFSELLVEEWPRWVLVSSDEAALDQHIARFLTIYGAGCVVLAGEHDGLAGVPSDRTNPWLRYNRPGRQIYLHDRGDHFPEPHRSLIAEALRDRR